MKSDEAVIDRIQLVAAAYHEAGHAVVAAAMRYDVFGCFIDEHGSGVMSFRWPAEEMATLEGRRRLLIVAAAGDVAEVIGLRFDDDPRDLDVDAGQAAVRVAWLAADGHERKDAARLEELAREEISTARLTARRMLDEEWDDVEAIASSIRPTEGGDA